MPVRSDALASMSCFVDFALAAGTERVRAIADFKRRQAETRHDLYEPIRAVIVDVHRRGMKPEEMGAAFEGLLFHATDKQRPHFEAIRDGHARFVTQHPGATWFQPPTCSYPIVTGLAVHVNPELGLRIDGVPHVVKLYTRAEPLSPKRVDFTVALMATTLSLPVGHKIAVLDVRKGELRYLSKKGADRAGWMRLQALVSMEMAAYGVGWGRV